MTDVTTFDPNGTGATGNLFAHLNKYFEKYYTHFYIEKLSGTCLHDLAYTMPYRSWQHGITWAEQQEILGSIKGGSRISTLTLIFEDTTDV